jgi:RecA-family ATPase
MTPSSNVVALTRATAPLPKSGTEAEHLVHHGLGDFLKRKFPTREFALSPWLPMPGLAMVSGWRGLGKTYFALSIAYAIASGGEVLGWKAERPRKVLYVDGEMDPGDLQERLAAIHAAAIKDGNGDPKAAMENLILLCDGEQANGMPDLAGEVGRARIEAKLKETGAEVLMLDNLSALFRNMGASANEEESWIVAQDWLVKLRRDRRTVLLIHHTGKPDKNGNTKQRGTSKREDVLNTSILLQLPKKQDKHRVNFVVEFTKARGFVPPDEFEVKIAHEGQESRLSQPDLAALVALMHDEGKTQQEIAEELEVSQSTVSRLLHKIGARASLCRP